MSESELEHQLRALKPLAPSDALGQAIARELAPSQAARGARRPPGAVPAANILWRRLFAGLGFACSGAAAAILTLSLLPPQRPNQPPPQASAPPRAIADPSPEFERAASAREFVSAQETDVLYTPGSEPARFVRFTSVERHVWQNPTTGAVIEVEAPREDVMLLPVSFQ